MDDNGSLTRRMLFVVDKSKVMSQINVTFGTDELDLQEKRISAPAMHGFKHPLLFSL
jgi:hypothetical protein